MANVKTAAIVLAAGMGTRMKSAQPKVMHPVGGRPMVSHLLATTEAVGVDEHIIVIGPDMAALTEAVAPHATALQTERLGTAHAVQAAEPLYTGDAEDVFVLCGDTPLITQETLKKMQDARRSGADVVVLGFTPDDPGAYGRLIVSEDGDLEKIVEFKDATEDERAVNLCNSGVMCINGKHLFDLVDRVKNDNAKGEYYLTDIVALARQSEMRCTVVPGSEEELLGVNSRVELAQAESIFQKRMRQSYLEKGVTMTAPETVFFSHDTHIDPDVVIEPNVVFGLGVTIETGVHILGFSHLEGAHVKSGVSVGPFARLRPGAVIESGAKIGNFVEVKKAVVEEGAKVNHLSYIGDAVVGAKANIGAGTITCNYDGFMKYKTTIGKGAFIGSNTALVAPVTVEDGALVGAGSVITTDVSGDSLALTRADQKEYKGWAANFRRTKQAEKAAKK